MQKMLSEGGKRVMTSKLKRRMAAHEKKHGEITEMHEGYWMTPRGNKIAATDLGMGELAWAEWLNGESKPSHGGRIRKYNIFKFAEHMKIQNCTVLHFETIRKPGTEPVIGVVRKVKDGKVVKVKMINGRL